MTKKEVKKLINMVAQFYTEMVKKHTALNNILFIGKDLKFDSYQLL